MFFYSLFIFFFLFYIFKAEELKIKVVTSFIIESVTALCNFLEKKIIEKKEATQNSQRVI